MEDEMSVLPRGAARLTPGYGRLCNLIFTEGRGAWVTTSDNRKLLDCTAGIAVTSTGHNHPKVVAAAMKQMQSMIHAQVAIGLHQPMLDLAEKLADIMPDPSLDSFFFATTGAEAVENAVKIARMYTGRDNVVVLDNAFHGRTFGTMSMTRSKSVYSGGFGSLFGNIYVTPAPLCHCCRNHGRDGGHCCNEPIRALKRLLKQQTRPQDVACILLEPIQGEGGYIVPPPGYLKQVREICDEHGIMLIADEIQSGMGRTGKWFAVEHEGVRPDLLLIAKGIASGFAVSAVACPKKLVEGQPPGSMGGTYAGGAVACAAACATIDVLKEEGALENAARRGEQLKEEMLSLQKSGKYPIIDVRGRGLMVAVEFDPSREGLAKKIAKTAIDHGLLLLTASAYEVLRFMPPLIISEEETREVLRRFRAALDDVMSKEKKSQEASAA